MGGVSPEFLPHLQGSVKESSHGGVWTLTKPRFGERLVGGGNPDSVC